jgi:hypothetical protein
VTVYLDVNHNGSFEDGTPVTTTVDPDDFAVGTVLTSAVPGVTLSAIDAKGQPFDAVRSFGSLFGHRESYGTEGAFWSDDWIVLRADFDGLASTVSVDARAYSAGSGARGRLRAFDANGRLLAEVLSEPLAADTSNRITITAQGIAYVLVSGTDSVLLEQLSFTAATVEPSAVTDADGSYVIANVPAGDYVVRSAPPVGWLQTSRGNEQNVFYGIAYVPNGNGAAKLVTIDAITGQVTWIGDPLPTRLYGLVKTNSGKLYATSYADDRLYEIDPATGATRLVGATDWDIVAGLAYDPQTDTLYSLGKTTANDTINRLLVIDRATGQATAIGPGMAGLTDTSGLAFDAAQRRVLAFDNFDGEFYAFDLAGNATRISVGPNVRTWGFSQGPNGFVLQPYGTGDQYLAPIDPDTGLRGDLFAM